MDDEDDNDNHQEDTDDAIDFAREGHRREDAQDIEGKKGHDDVLDGKGNDELELLKESGEPLQLQAADGHAQNKRKEQHAEHIGKGGNQEFEIRLDGGRSLCLIGTRGGHDVGEEPGADAVAQKGGEDGVAVGQNDGEQEKTSGSMAHARDGRHDEAENKDWHAERDELREEMADSGKKTCYPQGNETAQENAEDNSDEDARKKTDTGHFVIFLFSYFIFYIKITSIRAKESSKLKIIYLFYIGIISFD